MTVSVADVNDNQPVCAQSSYVATLPETAGMIILILYNTWAQGQVAQRRIGARSFFLHLLRGRRIVGIRVCFSVYQVSPIKKYILKGTKMNTF